MKNEINRKYHLIEELLEERQSVMILGPRASGKTFFLSRVLAKFKNTIQINLLNNAEFEKFISNPEHLYKEVEGYLEDKHLPLYVMIDEVQRIPKLLNEVHRLLEDKKGDVIFILTGSSARKLRRDEDINLLAGRAISIDFFPLSSLEIDFQKNLNSILKYGLLPEIFSLKSDKIKIEKLKTYVGTYLVEEIQKESEIRRIDKFNRFLEVAASLNGSGVNYSKIARSIDVSSPTVKEYFSILKDTLIAYSIPAWTYSVKRQIQQASKYYFFDNGVLNALLGELSSKLNTKNYYYGKLFENLIVTEIVKQINIKRLPLKLFNYRTTTNQEIDLIIQKNSNSTPVAIEIKSNTQPKVIDISPLEKFSKDYPNAKCIVLCQTDRKYIEQSIHFYPFMEGINKALEIAVE